MKKIKVMLFSLAFIWTTGLLVEFIIPLKSPMSVMFPFLRIFYSNVCHQNITKTISIDHHSMMVCTRCFGIYTGALISSLISIFYKPRELIKTRYIVIATLPMLTDIILYNTGIYAYSKIAAFFTGLLLGSIVFFYILDAFEKLLIEYKYNRNMN